jgi:AIG1 family
VLDALRALRAAGRRQLSILLLGKGGSGKSSTVNSLLGERSAPVSAFKLQPDTDTCVTYLRQVAIGDGDLDGFRLRVIDTCGLEDPEAGDTVNYGVCARAAAVCAFCCAALPPWPAAAGSCAPAFHSICLFLSASTQIRTICVILKALCK